MKQLIIADNASHLAVRAAEILVETANYRIRQNERFTMAVSGGGTPRPLYRLLAREPYCSRFPWEKTHMFWVDERCVSPTNTASNYGNAKRDFLDHVPMSDSHIHPMPVAFLPKEGTRRYEQQIKRHFGLKPEEIPVFDLILLGMGKDGHTASLFPGQNAYKDSKSLVVPVKGGDPDTDRLTMTLPVINSARMIMFLVSGRKKAETLKTVLEGVPNVLPAGKIRPTNGSLIWLVTRDAMSG